MIEIREYDGRWTTDSTSSEEILTLTEVKSFAHITDSSLVEFDLENDLILTSLIDSAVDHFEKTTGRYIIKNDVNVVYDLESFDVQIQIELPHIDVSDATITFYNEDNTAYIVDPSNYSVDSRRGKITIYDTSIPYNLRRFNSLIIDYRSGLAETSLEVTEKLRTALKQLITHWYENRQSVSDVNMYNVPDSAKRIFSSFKRRKI